MAKRLDEQFPWAADAEVLKNLRDLMVAIEARFAPLDAQSQNYAETVEQLRQVAIARLNEVLLPAYQELSALLDEGFGSERILDMKAYGRDLIRLADRAAFLDLLKLKITEIDLNGGTFIGPTLTNATASLPAAEAAGAQVITAKWLRDLLATLNYAPQGSMASFTAGARVLAPAAGDSSDRVPNTQWVAAAIAALVNSSPAALDTLQELATALGNDPNFATTMATALGLKAPLASPALTGTPTAPTAAAGTNTTQLATTAFVAALGALKANLASPALTGTPTAPTAAAGTNTTQLATTAFVQAAITALVNSSPAALDTLVELATALGNDPNFATTMATALGNRVRIDTAAQGLTAAQQGNGMTNLGIQAWARTMLQQTTALAGRDQLGLGEGQNVKFNSLRTAAGGDVDYYKAQHTLMGGGTVTWSGVRLSWTNRFMAMPIAPTSGLSGDSYVTMTQPTTNIPAANVIVVGTPADRTVAGGVELKMWEALYWEHTPGTGATGGRYIIVGYNAPGWTAPANWILVAAVNGDDFSLKLGNGQVMYSGEVRNFGQKTDITKNDQTSFKNKLINGNFEINQRGTSNGAVAYPAWAFVRDRWQAGANGATVSFTGTGNADHIMTISAGSVRQVIAGPSYLKKYGNHVLSNQGTAQARLYRAQDTPGAYAPCPLNYNVTGSWNLAVEFGTGTVNLAQFEPGLTPTPFEYRDDELYRCMRFYEQGVIGFAGFGKVNVKETATYHWQAPKIIAPSMTFTNTFVFNIQGGTQPEDYLYYPDRFTVVRNPINVDGTTVWYDNFTASSEIAL